MHFLVGIRSFVRMRALSRQHKATIRIWGWADYTRGPVFNEREVLWSFKNDLLCGESMFVCRGQPPLAATRPHHCLCAFQHSPQFLLYTALCSHHSHTSWLSAETDFEAISKFVSHLRVRRPRQVHVHCFSIFLSLYRHFHLHVDKIDTCPPILDIVQDVRGVR